MRIRLLFALVGLAVSFALPTFAQQQKSLKELIVGTWVLDSVYDQTQDGEKHNPWGDGVKGQAMFDAAGRTSKLWTIRSRMPTSFSGAFEPNPTMYPSVPASTK